MAISLFRQSRDVGSFLKSSPLEVGPGSYNIDSASYSDSASSKVDGVVRVPFMSLQSRVLILSLLELSK
jgi:hypothetical protein